MVVGSTPTEAVIYCRVDELVKSPVSETGVFVGSNPTSAVSFDGRYANGERTAFEAVV